MHQRIIVAALDTLKRKWQILITPNRTAMYWSKKGTTGSHRVVNTQIIDPAKKFNLQLCLLRTLNSDDLRQKLWYPLKWNESDELTWPTIVQKPLSHNKLHSRRIKDAKKCTKTNWKCKLLSTTPQAHGQSRRGHRLLGKFVPSVVPS